MFNMAFLFFLLFGGRVDSSKSDYDLEQEELQKELQYVESEIPRLQCLIADLSEQLRWAYAKRENIIGRIGNK